MNLLCSSITTMEFSTGKTENYPHPQDSKHLFHLVYVMYHLSALCTSIFLIVFLFIILLWVFHLFGIKSEIIRLRLLGHLFWEQKGAPERGSWTLFGLLLYRKSIPCCAKGSPFFPPEKKWYSYWWYFPNGTMDHNVVFAFYYSSVSTLVFQSI